MQTTQCPSCHSDVIIDDGLSKNDLVNCINCGAELEIISLHPLAIREFADISEEPKADSSDDTV